MTAFWGAFFSGSGCKKMDADPGKQTEEKKRPEKEKKKAWLKILIYTK